MATGHMFIEEVSAEYDVPVNTLRFWRQNGYGPKAVKIGRRLRYRRADVEAWFEQKFAAAN